MVVPWQMTWTLLEVIVWNWKLLFQPVLVWTPTLPWKRTESGAYTFVVFPWQSLNWAICVLVLYAAS